SVAQASAATCPVGGERHRSFDACASAGRSRGGMAKPARAGRRLRRRPVNGATVAGIEIRVCIDSGRLAGSEFGPELDLFRKARPQRAALAEIAAEPGSCVSAALNTGPRAGAEVSDDDHDQVVGYA